MEGPRVKRLQQEACYLYPFFFGCCPDPQVIKRYVLAHAHFKIDEADAECKVMETLMKQRLNAEAVEFLLRLRNRENSLTRKVAVLHYIAECRPELHALFVNERPGFLRGLFEVFGGMLRTVLLFVVGYIQVKRFGLA